MFFTSCIIIAFFCFAFYLIWNQFLKKDTRLSTGLKILRKKISDLQNLSSTVDTQVDRQGALMDEKFQRMEHLLQKSKEVCQQLESRIEIALALKNNDYAEPAGFPKPNPSVEKSKTLEGIKNPKPRFLKETPISKKESIKSSAIKAIHLKMVKDKPAKPKQAYFGESPFVKLGFVEESPSNNKNPSAIAQTPPPTT